MRCVTAKMNNILMDMAIAHYLDKDKRAVQPAFTFVSLWSDEEPYPLDELLFCLEERIADLEQQFDANRIEPLVVALSIARRKKRRLLQIQERINR